MRFAIFVVLVSCLAFSSAQRVFTVLYPPGQSGPLVYPASQFSSPNINVSSQDGRLILIVSKKGPTPEPRFQVGTEWKDETGIIAFMDSQMVFGVDVENWLPGTVRLRVGFVRSFFVPTFARADSSH